MKYIVVYWVIIIGADKTISTKNTQEFTRRKEAIECVEFLKKQNILFISGLKLDSLKIQL